MDMSVPFSALLFVNLYVWFVELCDFIDGRHSSMHTVFRFPDF
jgi:hypothetical protein